MAFVHGKDSTMSIDGTAIAARVDNASLNKVKDLAETTNFASTGDNKEFIDGLRSHEISIGGPWDSTLDGVMATADDGSSVLFDYSPDGTINYTGSCFISNYNISSPVGGRVEWTASFSVTGAVGRA